jgi:uncharacterized protein (DUF2344 family)
MRIRLALGELGKLLEASEWNINKKTKSGEKLINIRGMVKDFDYAVDNSRLVIKTVVACGSRENLSSDLLAQFIKSNTSGATMDAFVDIMREDMYAEQKDEFVSLSDYVR